MGFPLGFLSMAIERHGYSMDLTMGFPGITMDFQRVCHVIFYGCSMVFPWIFYGLAPVDFDTELIIFCLIHLLLVQVAVAIADSHMLQPVFQNSANTDIPETY